MQKRAIWCTFQRGLQPAECTQIRVRAAGLRRPQAAARCALSGTNSEFIVQKIQNYKIGPQLRPAKARYSRPAGPLLRALRKLRPAFHLEF